jgi:hypothetical protein
MIAGVYRPKSVNRVNLLLIFRELYQMYMVMKMNASKKRNIQRSLILTILAARKDNSTIENTRNMPSTR